MSIRSPIEREFALAKKHAEELGKDWDTLTHVERELILNKVRYVMKEADSG